MKKEWIINRQGKDHVLYVGLLDLAHEQGLKAITTTLVQIPTELNGHVAICHAIVEVAKGTFTGLGDADPTNVSRAMAPHLIRFAETRAKARALRDALNIGMVALEELADDAEPVTTNGRSQPREFGEAVAAGHVPEATAPEDALGVARGHFRAMAQRALKVGEDVMPATEMVKLNLNQLRDAFKELRTRVEAAERRGIPAER